MNESCETLRKYLLEIQNLINGYIKRVYNSLYEFEITNIDISLIEENKLNFYINFKIFATGEKPKLINETETLYIPEEISLKNFKYFLLGQVEYIISTYELS